MGNQTSLESMTPEEHIGPGKPRFIDIPKGKVFVVTDLHGHLPDFEQAIRKFRRLKSEGLADYLVFLGDLIHARGYADHSTEILDRLVDMGLNDPSGNVFALLGNHEMVHIYHIELWRGESCHTSAFEEAIAEEREKYIRILMNMPFAIRTQGGTLLHHTGAGAILGTRRQKEFGIRLKMVRNWSHEEILKRIFAQPHFTDLDPYKKLIPYAGIQFKTLPEGIFLWEFLMNKNEKEYGKVYAKYQKQFLTSMFKKYSAKGRVMVTGHIQVPKGMEIINGVQLRLSSSMGAKTNNEKMVLLFDAAREYENAFALAKGCMKLYKR